MKFNIGDTVTIVSCPIKKHVGKTVTIIDAIPVLSSEEVKFNGYIGTFSPKNENSKSTGFYKVKVNNKTVLGYAEDEDLKKD